MRDLLTPTRRALGLALAAVGCALAPGLEASARDAASPPPRLEILAAQVLETEDGARVELTGTGALEWAMSFEPGGRVAIRLPNAVPAPGLARMHTGSGLITAVELERQDLDQSVATRVLVSTRTEAATSVSSQGNRLLVDLRPRSTAREPAPAAQAEPSPPPPRPDALGETNSHIGPGDVLEITVFGLPELDRKVRVAKDGTISLPLLGNFAIAGSTVLEAERVVAGMLAGRRLVNDPQVSIFVEEIVSRTVSVQGAVAKPGSYPMKGRSTLLDLLGAAGGLDEKYGDQIVVLRTDEAGTATKIEIDSERLITHGDAELNLVLEPGDIVMVPQAREFRVYVTGAVVRPGPVEYLSSEGITVLQAITAAGGPTERANFGNVSISRRLADGSQKRVKVNAKKIQRGKTADLPLERNDTVVVGEWFF
jgi:polysaccharide export outer membrane protein